MGGMLHIKLMLSDITLYVGKESRPGNSSISPVLVLKQAPCQGHLTLFPIKAPVQAIHFKKYCRLQYQINTYIKSSSKGSFMFNY